MVPCTLIGITWELVPPRLPEFKTQGESVCPQSLFPLPGAQLPLLEEGSPFVSKPGQLWVLVQNLDLKNVVLEAENSEMSLKTHHNLGFL